MVGDRRGQRASEGESVGAALVRAEPPAAGHRLVHRAADERVPEAEAPGNVRLTDEIQAQQLVDRVDRCRLGGSGGRGGQLGIEGLSRDGGALEDEACLLGEQSELLGERGSDRSRDVDAGERRLVGRRRRVGTVGRPRELLEVEGIAAAVLVEAGRVRSVADQLAGLLGAERLEVRCARSCRRGAPVRPRRRAARPSAAVARRARRVPARPAVGGGARRAARSTPDRPSGRRRARAPPAGSARASRAARRRRGDCGSARAGSRSCARLARPVSDGKTVASSARTSPSRLSRRCGSRPWTYSSSASTKTQNGKSSSSSPARPERTRYARASARAANSARRRVLPIPGSPTSSSAADASPADLREETVDRAELRRAADEMGGKCHLSLPASP